jgi:hypothetical protein
MLKTNKSGGTTQIDHVVISPYGIFVIETKSHKGMIFGDYSSRNWTQTLIKRTGVERYSFYSPYLQNYGHLKNLYKLTGLSNQYFLGLICFTSPSVDLTNVNCDRVVHVDYLYNAISRFKDILLTPQQAMYYVELIRNNNIQSAYFDRKHVSYVKGFQKNRRN